MEVKELRKQLKAIGFGFKTGSNSLGVFGNITKDKVDIPSIFWKDQLDEWKPAIDLVESCKPITRDGDKVIVI